jgi:putative Mg2+ transporter-C (MgtC) family protein
MDVGNSYNMVETHLPSHIIAIRLSIAAALGAMIGFERETHTAQAGLRTHILVAVAAALFTILAFQSSTPSTPAKAVWRTRSGRSRR